MSVLQRIVASSTIRYGYGNGSNAMLCLENNKRILTKPEQAHAYCQEDNDMWSDVLELQNIENNEAYRMKKELDDVFMDDGNETKDKNKRFDRNDSWKYHRNRHYDHRYCDRWYVDIKGTDGFSKQDKLYYRRLFRRSLSKHFADLPIKGNFYKKTMWWDRNWS